LFAEKDPVWEKHLLEKLLKTKLKLSLELGRKKFMVREILDWKVGDEILLNVSKDDKLRLCVEGIPKFFAKLGKVKNRYAALITDFYEEEEEEREAENARRREEESARK